MATIPDRLLSLFTASLEYRGGRYYIEVPASEVSRSSIDDQSVCQIALLSSEQATDSERSQPSRKKMKRIRVGGERKMVPVSSTKKDDTNGQRESSPGYTHPSWPSQSTEPVEYDNDRWSGSTKSSPPVSENDIIEVEIESVGSKGDGIAKVGTGFVVMVPDTRVGDEVTVQIESVRENYSFGRVV